MQILVTVKEVGQLGDEVVIEDGEIAESALEYDLNEWDEYALESAVQLSEAYDDVEVVTATIGPERSDETIRMALAKGADRAVRIWDDALTADGAGDETPADGLLDTRVRVELLSAIVEREEPDLVLSGVQSADAAFASTGVALAEEIDDAWAAVVNDLEVDPDAGTASVHRELEGGIEELTDVPLPAVLTIQTGINEPRYASLRGIRQAQSKELTVLDLDDLGIGTDAVTGALETTALYEPETTSDATIWEGDAESTAGELAAFLRDSGVIEG
ncbi:electron transfer flavoprotein subunit beta/FixA family protein [Salinarchaeum laminariae]|uniref:electron transfer flavoprotein subunit beta/FixA family protein n=1 Tax=Salinarchaeum laminariae TaxID=869888 RepID=UPI0020BDE878|nr:electron transfer flavoprotein subunit beta/FixA family protein [Salinarchaeum laminariae]